MKYKIAFVIVRLCKDHKAKRVKQEQYKNILEAHLLPQLSEWFPNDEKPTFMQDGAPCHKARTVAKFLEG